MNQLVSALLFPAFNLLELLWILILVLLLVPHLTTSSCTLPARTLNKANIVLRSLIASNYFLILLIFLLLATGVLLDLRFQELRLFQFLINLSLFVALGILTNNVRSKALMSFKARNRQILKLLVVVMPLILHLVLEILRDLEVLPILFSCIFENLLDHDLINVLEVKLVVLAFVSIYLVGLQNLKDVLLLNDYQLLLVEVETVFADHSVYLVSVLTATFTPAKFA